MQTAKNNSRMLKSIKAKVVRGKFTARLAFSDFKGKYAGAALGGFWALAEPAVSVLIYWFVYRVVFNSADVDGVPYYLWLAAGIAPWFFISNGVLSVAAAFRDYSYLVKKMKFDKGTLPTVRALSALISHLIFLALVAAVSLFCGTSIKGIVCLTVSVFMACIFVLALGRIFAVVCAYCKDVLNVLGVVFNIGFWLTPVFWNSDNLSGAIAKIVNMNPAAIIVKIYREALLLACMPRLDEICCLTVWVLVLFLVGEVLYKKLLPNISDVL